MFVVLASEPVGGRSQATELPCYSCKDWYMFHELINLEYLMNTHICLYFIFSCWQGLLNKHIQTTHEGQKNFQCDLCDKTFGTKYGAQVTELPIFIIADLHCK